MQVLRPSFAFVVALAWMIAVIGASHRAVAQEFEPVYLDEPEPPPKPKVVQRVDKQATKYPDGTLLSERGLLRLSDNSLVNHGPYTEYYRNGEKFAQGAYDHGVHHGEWTYWYDNGQLCKTIVFQTGKADGSWEVFDREGRIMRTESYKNGKRDGKWTTYYDGGEQLKLEITLVDGKIHGERIGYFRNGKVQNRTQFVDGKFHGESITYDESGRPRAKINFSEGKLDGEARYWDAEGRERVRIYKDGELVQRDASAK